MRFRHIQMTRISARIQAFFLVAALALMLGLAGWLLGGIEMALGTLIAVLGLYGLQPLMAPQLMFRIQGGRPLAPQAAPDLYQMVETLAQRAGLVQSPRLYYLPGNVMNAFTVGSGQHALLGVSDALLRHLNREEVAAVLAHEMAHIRNQDTRVMVFAALLSQLIQGMSLLGQLLLLVNLPLILAGHEVIGLGGILILILSPYIGLLLQLALSRSREYLADADAAALVGSSQPLARALIKIERHNQGLGRHRFGWPGIKPVINNLLRTHPPTHERVLRLLQISRSDIKTTFAPRAPFIYGPTAIEHLIPDARSARCRALGICP